METTHYTVRIISITNPGNNAGLSRHFFSSPKTIEEIESLTAEDLNFLASTLVEKRGADALKETYMLQASPFGYSWTNVVEISPHSPYGRCIECDDELEHFDAKQGDERCGICRDNAYIMANSQ